MYGLFPKLINLWGSYKSSGGIALRILLTNDDGIGAAGIQALWHELSHIAEVIVVAPDVERSATSQAITVHSPIRVDQYTFDNPRISGWRIGGTPADCVKIALGTLLTQPPDLIVSGINHGPNLGTDVLYSGTVSAAIEGALHGIPAVAVSLDGGGNYDFAPAAKFMSTFIPKMMSKTLPADTLLNINIPAVPTAQMGGTVITKLGVRQYDNIFEGRKDPRGRMYYWLGGNIIDNENEADSDIVAVKLGKVSVTPIHFDLTNYNAIKLVESWNL